MAKPIHKLDKYRDFDAVGFFRALESTMVARGKNWKQVAAETSVSASTLARMAQDRLPDAPSLAALSAWAGLNPAEFVLGNDAQRKRETLAEITRALHADENLSGDEAQALDEIIRTAYRRLASKPKGP